MGSPIGFGERPAIMVIDMQNDFIDPRAISTVAPASQEIIPHIKRVLDMARAKKVPVFYTRGLVNPDGVGESLWRFKMKSHRDALCQIDGTWGAEITTELAPQPGDVVINKRRPSAFFRTELEVFLHGLQIDTLIFCGASVSGCVRASVLDAFMRDYRCMIPRECVADRHADVYEANLFDMDSKYADVMQVDEVYQYLEGLPSR